MPRENSISDEGRSLTPDLEIEEPKRSFSPPHSLLAHGRRSGHSARSKTHSPAIPRVSTWAYLSPKEKFKAAARRIISIRRGITVGLGPAGDEPGVDPRRPSAEAYYGHIRNPCEIEIVDYSSVRFTSKRYTNEEFVKLLDVASSEPVPRQPWVKVRWINIGGISWDVLSALAIKYSMLEFFFYSFERSFG